MHAIHTADAPTPLGHYVQAQASRGHLFVSVQLPVTPGDDPHRLVGAPADQQATRVMANLGAILEAAGCTPRDVVKLMLYVAGIEHWDAANAAAAGFLGPHKPARGVLAVSALHRGYLVAADLVAEVPRA
jgi:reactive intermediate/imine deaminase